MPTPEQNAFILELFGVNPAEYRPRERAAPGGADAVDIVTGGRAQVGPAHADNAPGMPPGSPSNATGTVRTPYGDFVYFVAAEPPVEPVITEIVDEFLAAQDLDLSLSRASGDLEALENKYSDESGMFEEINHYTDRALKDEAGAARGAGIVDDGFKAFVQEINTDLEAARENLRITTNDLKAEDLSDQAAELARIGKEIQEQTQSLLDGFTKVLQVSAHIAEAWVAPEIEAGHVLELATDLFSTFSAGSNEWLAQAAKLEKAADSLKKDGIKSRAKLAAGTVQNLQKGVNTWQPIVARAAHDLETKQATRDGNYDSKKSDGKVSKSFSFTEVKKAIELARDVHDLAMRTAAAGHALMPLIAGVQKLHPDPQTWMVKPGQGEAILYKLSQDTRALYTGAEGRVNWSRPLVKKFVSLYVKAGEAIADAPGTGR